VVENPFGARSPREHRALADGLPIPTALSQTICVRLNLPEESPGPRRPVGELDPAGKAGLRSTAMSWWVKLGLGAVLVGSLLGCQTYRSNLDRGQRYYDENEYEHALAMLRLLEEDMTSLTAEDQTRYAYLRGMTDYRLQFRSHARHWLGLAMAMEELHPGGLQPDWSRRANEALTDLNKDVYGVIEPAPVAENVESAPDSTDEAGDELPELPEKIQCEDDSACPGDQVCLNGLCSTP